MSHKELRDQAKRGHDERVSRIKRACGGSEREVAAKEVHKHEHHMHPGEKETKLLSGGAAKKRLDRKKGGRVKGGKTEVNVIISPRGPQASPPGAIGAPGPMAGPPTAPPMPPPGGPPGMPPMGAMPPRPPMAGMPPGMPPGGPMPMRKRGGKVKKRADGLTEYDAGAGTGLGRLEKAAAYGARK